MSGSEPSLSAQVGHVESLPGSEASAIPVDHDSPLVAAGPLREAPEELAAAERQQPLIREDPSAAAFFDLDNTMIQGGSLFYLAKGMYQRGFFPTRVILKGIWIQAYFRVVGREKPGHIEDVRSVTLGFIEGHTVTELTELANEVYEESIAERIWPGTRALAQMHLDVGQQVWLVTAAPRGARRYHRGANGANRSIGHHRRAHRRGLYRAAER
jgi:hypothetical protein